MTRSFSSFTYFARQPTSRATRRMISLMFFAKWAGTPVEASSAKCPPFFSSGVSFQPPGKHGPPVLNQDQICCSATCGSSVS